ncbi:MAG: acetyl-CoA carboxylase biotin carboxylase subunit [Candidatus Palauibacterales bacterium]|nr:acetyl-CoA carboxylase biotin carboxylase subunit [Candidatus Palauibacterales bacterium]MDP2584566.1 acetyl-CoA carboxylase biotin carboxylase subunit [Candidatus Palauibacterales bacterium]
MSGLRRVLIANRGEIAVRVIRACRELGIETVAVYSDPDRLAPHVRLADRAVLVGPAPASESYLDVGRLLEAARRTGADSVHPGYGFLAENASFAGLVEDAGLVWIGPPPNAIAAMGDKTEARERMRSAGVPVIPGSEGALDDPDAAREAADRIGYPVMLKAAAGGGGKGMRVVRAAGEFESAFRGARSEAGQAFGDERVYLERFLDAPRHIEIQVLADAHGRTVHVGERECSIQRRHQKLIEEAPSPVVDAELRERMGRVAVAAAEAVGYRSAGTVEFLFQDDEFFFLEMNTRIQVEHPVTELVWEVDLVQEQLRIAGGDPILWQAPDEAPRGHAVECRIGGEDPFAGFLPSAGRVVDLEVPSGPGVRWDGGIEPGFEVGLHYDPLLAKLLVHAPTREEAIDRMARALDELEVVGLATSAPFHRAVMREPDFRAGRLSIRYVEEHADLLREPPNADTLRAVAAAAALLEEERRQGAHPRTAAGTGSADGAAARSAWQRTFDPL